ncbi:MAG: penicillin-binding protein [Patescibacteria group bacterium]|nr:penicillin-binding protein [Patescibacteria group bacterium]
MKLFSKFVPIFSRKKRNLKPEKRRRFRWKNLLFYSLCFVVVLVLATAVSFAWFAKDLPTPSKIANRKATESTKIYDRTGQVLLYETGDQKRTIVQSDQLPQNLKDATVAVEDADFYKHHGFNTKSLIRAVWYKVTHKTNRLTGASTITQQYVKNALLSSDRSYTRKIKELILSIELEFMYKKSDILTMYLNEIPYGNSTAGAEAASRMYYGKTAKDLTLAQAATLVAIPQSPTYYSPYGTHTDKLIARRNYVLDRMVSTGKISKEEAEKAKQEDTTTLGVALKPRKDTILAPHFAMYVIERVAEQYGEDAVQKEGLKIITTLDYDKQKAAEEAVNGGVKKINQYGASNAGLVAIDPKNGQILSMIGSIDYFNTQIDGNVNITDSLRQPGSSFKPYTYATLLKKPEYSPSRILFDFQTDFGGGYVPKNYNGRFNGPVTIRQALSNSLNIPAVKAMSLAGMDNVIRTAEDMGITSLNQRSRYGLSLALGTAEVRPVETAGGFGVFANGGVKHDLNSVLKITDSKGKVVYEYNKDRDTGRQVLDPQIAYEIANILSDNNARSLIFGAHSSLFFPNRTVAVKTGTTSDNKDAWSVGFTPSISVAVWVGNNNGTIMKGGADGSVVAAPIFHAFIDKSLADTPNEEFKQPEGMQTVTVERYSNKLPNDGYSGETTTDIFAQWQIPTEKDDIHQELKICKVNGKLAPDTLPENLMEKKAFANIHSERPDNPNWEDPVHAWALENGLVNEPPKDYCSINDFTPSVSISSPVEGASISSDLQIEALYSSPVNAKSVEFFIDDISIGSVLAAPFTKTYSISSLSNGTHKVSAIATDENGNTSRSDVTITIAKQSAVVTPPKNSEPIIAPITTPTTEQQKSIL